MNNTRHILFVILTATERPINAAGVSNATNSTNTADTTYKSVESIVLCNEQAGDGIQCEFFLILQSSELVDYDPKYLYPNRKQMIICVRRNINIQYFQ